MRAIINSIKHYFHTPSTVIVSGAQLAIVLVNALAKGAARATAVSVEEGCIVKAVYLEYWIAGATALNTAAWCVVKRPAGVVGPTAAQMANLGSYPNKKNIFHAGEGLVPANGNTLSIYKGWIKIPKGKQRFGLGDLLQVNIAAVGTTVNVCGLTVYKEYE